MTMAKSEENKYPMCADKNNWFEKSWCETVEFQKQGWEDSKTQLTLNKKQIVNLPETITISITQSFTDVSSYFNSLLSKTNDK